MSPKQQLGRPRLPEQLTIILDHISLWGDLPLLSDPTSAGGGSISQILLLAKGEFANKLLFLYFPSKRIWEVMGMNLHFALQGRCSSPSWARPQTGCHLGELLKISQPLLGVSARPLWGWKAGFSQCLGPTQSCSHDHPSLKHQRGLAEELGKISLEYGPLVLRLLPSTRKAPNLSDAFYDFFSPHRNRT